LPAAPPLRLVPRRAPGAGGPDAPSGPAVRGHRPPGPGRAAGAVPGPPGRVDRPPWTGLAGRGPAGAGVARVAGRRADRDGQL
jgi:hypothetical protein